MRKNSKYSSILALSAIASILGLTYKISNTAIIRNRSSITKSIAITITFLGIWISESIILTLSDELLHQADICNKTIIDVQHQHI